MINEIQIFEDTFENSNVEIMIDNNGELLFELYSTGMALGYYSTAKGKRYPYKDRINNIITNADITCVSHGVKLFLTEEMLYDFMLEAKSEKCKPFRKWITSKVVPSIRKTGSYSIQQKPDSYMIEDPIARAERWIGEEKVRQALAAENEHLTIENQEMKPKADYYEDVMRSDSVVPIKTVAKDFGMSSQKLNQILKDNHIQYKQGKRWYLYEQYADKGYTKSQTCLLPNGDTITHTYWTNKGVEFIHDLLNKLKIKAE